MDHHRFEVLTSSNSTLSALEIDYLRQQLNSRSQAIARLQNELKILQSECETYESLLSPLRRNAVPLEILGLIFTKAVLNSQNSLPSDEQVQRICLVCRGWRNAALATPAIWGQLELKGSPPVNFATIQRWLSRAGTLPRRLSIIDECSHEGIDEDHPTVCPWVEAGLPALLTEAPTPKELILILNEGQCLQHLLNAIQKLNFDERPDAWELWDSIQDLQFVANQWHDPSYSHCLHSDLLNCFSQESMSSLSVTLPSFLQIDHLSFPNLTELELALRRWPVKWVLDSLAESPALRYLTINL
ncbi:hypothetical protein FA13DRAFT_1802988 [Coprinellus micaceus]|uniref:Uncharacterized protein n=1 Tax=Coprinellus micaceus TaxID=71717 RepID=A0A4Y7SC27_COPMI|nr:hypothetical protein FA13DRAFT_1802988 [Coprinellus micaceus]